MSPRVRCLGTVAIFAVAVALDGCAESSSQSDRPDMVAVLDGDVDADPADTGADDIATVDDAMDTSPGDVPTSPDTVTADTLVADVPVDAPRPDAGPPPARGLDRVHLYVNLGDSVAAGFNASGGRGFSAMLFANHAAYPAYAGHDLTTLFPGIVRRDLSQSGATSTDVLSRLRGAIGGLPAGADGDDTIVTINAGGNDLNDNIFNIIDRARTVATADTLTRNYDEIFRLLRMRYLDPARGRQLVVLVSNVYDPTDGTGRIPITFTMGFCRALNNPLLTDPLRAASIMNMAYFNGRVAANTMMNGGHLVDHARIFLGHGMNAAGAERWLDNDCTHPVNTGHHEMRREWFFVLTGMRY